MSEQATEREEDHDSDFSGNTRDSKKKGVSWSLEEHQQFLLGLKKIGKGDWRGISRQFVQTRSPTQVASHAQKYFIRQSVAGKRKRRSSLFDLVPEGPVGGQSRLAGQAAGEGAAAAKAEPQPLPRAEGPPGFPFPGLPQGPEAFAMACLYQNMVMQQGPMAWMQAMCIHQQQQQQQQSHTPLFYPPHQGFGRNLGPGMPPPGFPFLPLGQGQGGQMTPQQQQQQAMMMMAHQQQQQQLAAAYAMGSMHSFTSSMVAPQGAVSGNIAPSISQIEPEKSDKESYSAYMPRDFLAASADRQSESLGFKSEEPPPEQFGNGMLIRPKAQKALPPQPHEAGGLPSYMTVSQTTSAPHPTTSSYSECIQPGDPEDSQRNPAESSACGVTASSATQFRGVTPGGSEAPRKLGSAKQHSPRGGKQESGLSVSGWP